MCRPWRWGGSDHRGLWGCQQQRGSYFSHTQGCNMENPFILIFCRQTGSAPRTLLACQFSSWPVSLRSPFSAGTRVPVPTLGPRGQKRRIYNTRRSRARDGKCRAGARPELKPCQAPAGAGSWRDAAARHESIGPHLVTGAAWRGRWGPGTFTFRVCLGEAIGQKKTQPCSPPWSHILKVQREREREENGTSEME